MVSSDSELQPTVLGVKMADNTYTLNDIRVSAKNEGADSYLDLDATLYWGGFMIGRMVSAGLKNVAPRPMLIIVTVAAIVLMSVSMFTENLWLPVVFL